MRTKYVEMRDRYERMTEEREYFRQALETAEAALAAAAVPCECGMAHHGFLLHGHRYCPNCGHPVEVAL